jgi:hypothetical protein
MPGKYKALYEYLENRYANTVVLTFAQIEDLLGFTLPDAARVDQEWWANKDPNDTSPPHSRSWNWPVGQPRRTCRPRPLFLNERTTDTCGDFLTRPSLIHPFTP